MFTEGLALFGYIRPIAEDLRLRDRELYEEVYCGICRDIRLRYGLSAAMALSYDLVLVALLGAGGGIAASRRTCPAHPFCGRKCGRCRGRFGTGYASDCGIILAYAKLSDDISDGSFPVKLRASALRLLLHRHYKKAAKERPSLAAAVERCMKEHFAAERSGTRSLDRLSEPSAAMLRAVFRELGGYDPDLRTAFGDLGYMLGRFVYICDALDDLPDDMNMKKGRVNPFVPYEGAEAGESAELTLAALEDIYSRLPAGVRSRITDNIIYEGLGSTFREISEKRRTEPLR